jgi:DNA-binding response OmpR family regulator
VVDDRPADLAALTEALDDPRRDVVAAQSGAEALRHLLRDSFAVVVLDVLLPDVHGLEVARLMREREPTRDTPILLLSAAGVDMGFVSRTLRGGPIDYLQKPVDREALLDKIDLLLGHEEPARISEVADADARG